MDIYAEAKVSDRYGRLDYNGGASFRKMLKRAAESNSVIVQIATWNDWGEGTQIEPSDEFGYRDLEIVQQLQRPKIAQGVRPSPEDLLRPIRILQRRRQATGNEQHKVLDRVAKMIGVGDLAAARTALRTG